MRYKGNHGIYSMASESLVAPWKTVKFQKGLESNHCQNTCNHRVLARLEKDDEELILHAMRDDISRYEDDKGEGTWEYYKKCVNPYEFVFTQKRYNTFPDSVCMLRPLSRSYFKMIEMLSISHFFEDMQQKFSISGSNSVRVGKLYSGHVCEGPGGFIEGFIDGCSGRRMCPERCSTMTLYSTNTNVPGWRRASNFIRHNRCVQITYGDDGTGDILKPENQTAFIRECNPKVHLFTGDGGFDFSTDYDSQEVSVFPLLVATTRVGLESLDIGGFFIIKLFDFYNPATIDLIYFISIHFESWTLYKPAMSRPCNSEQYLIGCRFKGCHSFTSDVMKSWYANIQTTNTLVRIYSDPLPSEFMKYLLGVRTASFNSQIRYLSTVFDIIENGTSDDIVKILKHHEFQSYDWCKRFNVPVCRRRAQIIEGSRTDLQDAGRR